MVFGLFKKKEKEQKRPLKKTIGDINFAYEKSKSLTTPTEQKFFNLLIESIDDQYYINKKVRMEDVINVKRRTEKKEKFGFRSRIKLRHIDFTISKKQTGEIIKCIELDDLTHLKNSKQASDDIIDKIFETAGVSLLRIPVQTNFEVGNLEKAIKDNLQEFMKN